ncbi:DUF3097 domain-containing protein [Winkia neuii]|uniref:DUF3097 domain-containing protein n=1 Tax=Winkia neuii TaxID=33007 RepID=UPI0023A97856|nr:DUF3097 domain-containing protein [Winkia neuii]WEB73491.1 DUF3097 domain-containing protein [Winkia neuii]
MFDRYGSDVLANDPHRRPTSTEVPAKVGLVVEDVESGWVGAILRTQKIGGMHVVELEDAKGRVRSFPLGPGYWIDGKPVTLVPVAKTRQSGLRSSTGRKLTNSGSYALDPEPAKVAKASRIWVEGKHDAELVEHIWGDDLRHEGVVVELLEGVDNLECVLSAFSPSRSRKAGVLVDHLVAGSKESRIAAGVAKKYPDSVLVLGHPFVDIWQAVKPARLGLRAWPNIPKGTDIKKGTLAALGWPHSTQADIAQGWKRILRTVRTYKDLEPALLGKVEALIDFVTCP